MDLEARVTDSRVSAYDESADSVQPSKAVSKKPPEHGSSFRVRFNYTARFPSRFRVNRRRKSAVKD